MQALAYTVTENYVNKENTQTTHIQVLKQKQTHW